VNLCGVLVPGGLSESSNPPYRPRRRLAGLVDDSTLAAVNIPEVPAGRIAAGHRSCRRGPPRRLEVDDGAGRWRHPRDRRIPRSVPRPQRCRRPSRDRHHQRTATRGVPRGVTVMDLLGKPVGAETIQRAALGGTWGGGRPRHARSGGLGAPLRGVAALLRGLRLWAQGTRPCRGRLRKRCLWDTEIVLAGRRHDRHLRRQEVLNRARRFWYWKKASTRAVPCRSQPLPCTGARASRPVWSGRGPARSWPRLMPSRR
jgi:hypothetical protein